MFRMGGLTDEDKLDKEATKQVLRRAIRMARPFRRTIVGALGFVLLSTLGLLLGPVIVRYGIDNGIDMGDTTTLRNAVFAYIGGGGDGVFRRSPAVHLHQPRRRGFPPCAPRPYVRPHPATVARLLRPLPVGRADLAHDCRHRVDGRTRPVGAAAVRGSGVPDRARADPDAEPVVAAHDRRVARDADHHHRLAQVPTRLERRLPRSARAGRTEPVGTPGGHRGRARRAGLRAGAGADPAVRRVEPVAVQVTRAQHPGVDLVLRSGRGARASSRPAWRSASAAGSSGAAMSPSAPLSPSCCSWPNCSSRSSSCRSCTTPCSRRPRHSTSSSPSSTREPDIEGGDDEFPERGDLVVDGVGFTYPSTDTPVLRDVSISVADGERLALVGPTGAGKSTVAKLMARLYDPSEGTISFGGIDLRDATLDSLRRARRGRAAGGLPVRRVDRRQRSYCPGRRHRRRTAGGARRNRRARTVRLVRGRNRH